MKKIGNFFREVYMSAVEVFRIFLKRPPRSPITHDYREEACTWGHDLLIKEISKDGKRIKAVGFGDGVVVGDLMVITQDGGGDTRYCVMSIRYVDGTWMAELEFMPRTPQRRKPAAGEVIDINKWRN